LIYKKGSALCGPILFRMLKTKKETAKRKEGSQLLLCSALPGVFLLRFLRRKALGGVGSVLGGVLTKEKRLHIRRFLLEPQDRFPAQGLAVALAGVAPVQALGTDAAIVPFGMDHVAFDFLAARTAAAHRITSFPFLAIIVAQIAGKENLLIWIHKYNLGAISGGGSA
jgi:hypothetical protein